MYNEFKNDIGKSPEEFLEISDFDSNIELFIELVSKVGSFYEAQIQFENNNFIKYYRMKNPKTDLLAYMEKKIRLCEPFTYLTVKFFLKSKYKGQNLRNKYINSEILLSEYKKYFSIKDKFKNFYLLERIFNELIEDEILEADLYGYKISKKYEAIFYEEDKNFEKRLSDLINLGLNEFRKNDIEEFNDNVLITHKEYKRIDLQILLDSKVPKGTWRAGYANTEKDICLFITNDKSHIMQENLKYDNSLHSDEIIQWISQPKTYHSSSVGQMFIKHREKQMKVHIFARKYAFMNGNKTNPFIYLGQADYYRSFGDKPMTILWKLRRKLPQELIQELYKL